MTDTESAIEWFLERSAIREFDGEMPRPNAESAALRDVRDTMGLEAARAVQRWRLAPKGEGYGD